MMDIQKRGLPVFTVFICLLCLFIYWQQYRIDTRHNDAVTAFCSEPLDANTDAIHQHIESAFPGVDCRVIYATIRRAAAPAEQLREIVQNIEPLRLFADGGEDRAYMFGRLAERYQRYSLMVPKELTSKLAYDPAQPDLWRMLTSTFSHADAMHLFGNLLGFFIFAAAVEMIVGNLLFAAFVAIATVAINLGYSYAMSGVPGALPTVGLSGVVMAAVAALAIMVPRAQIRCFFWFLLVFRVFRLPAWLLALWYVGWDLFDMNRLGVRSYVNYAAHLSGAALGVLFGFGCLVFASDAVDSATEEYSDGGDLPLTTLSKS